jgi:hypothetical protein
MPLILGPTNAAIDTIRRIRDEGGLERVTALVAWARIAGVALFLDALGTDINKVRIVVGMAGAGTSVEALSYLRAHCAEVHLFHKHHRQTFHPKIYCFDGSGDPPTTSHLIVGSSNLTGGGLFSNYEASLVSTLTPASSTLDRETWSSAMSAFDAMVASPFSEHIINDDRIQVLLEERYLSTESRLRRRGTEDAAAAARGSIRRGKPEAPPTKLVLPPLPPPPRTFTDPAVHAVPSFPVAPTPPTPSTAVAAPAQPMAVPAEPFVADGRFFVRTLTPNDVAKILGHQVGTFEPDLGVTARDELPGFWGWPNRFVTVTRKLPREEWAARARVFSSAARTGTIEFMLWFRAARPPSAADPRAHAAEFRFRIGPKGTFQSALPLGFGVTSLVVIERLPDDTAYDFRIGVIAEGEPEHADYSRYLTHVRPQHSYGYGPDDPDE